MKMNKLGKTTIEVSEICFGTLTLGPLQKNMNHTEALSVMRKAVEEGVNFFDTADMYNTYDYLRPLLKTYPELVICTRSYDYSAEGVRKSLERALRETGRDYVDLYLLHEQESRYTFEGHMEAVEELVKAKKAGKVRALGISTHRVEAVRDSLDYPMFEVLFPLLNVQGLGIEDGSAQDMIEAIGLANAAGKGVFGMKPLGGGNLIADKAACFEFVRRMLAEHTVASYAFGMQSVDEVVYNCAKIAGRPISRQLEESVRVLPRSLHIDDWCEGCGACVNKCHQQALHLENGKSVVDSAKCLTCGYCASVCPVFAIKVV